MAESLLGSSRVVPLALLSLRFPFKVEVAWSPRPVNSLPIVSVTALLDKWTYLKDKRNFLRLKVEDG
jgi:hypothetical protein